MILIADDSKPRWIDAFVREDDAMLVNVGQRAMARIPANSRTWVEAKVAQVGLHTQSLDGSGGSADGARNMQPERVWIKIVPTEPFDEHLVTGTTAKAVVWVR